MINLGSTPISRIYVGSDEVSKVFLGDKQVYPNYTLSLSLNEMEFEASGQSKDLGISVSEGQSWELTIPDGFVSSKLNGVGSDTVQITVSNNMSETPVVGELKVVSEGLEASCTLSQAAGSKEYLDPEVSLSYSDIPAGGGLVHPVLSYSQLWTWNGVSGSGGTITSGGSVTYSGSMVSSSDGSVSAASKETVESGRTKVTTSHVTVSLNGKVGETSFDVYQQENVPTLTGISANTLSYDAIPVLGGSSSPYYSISGSYSYTSGSTSTSVIDSVVRSRMRAATAATKSFAFVAPVAGFTIDSGTGVISATETEQSSEKVAQVKMSVEYEGFSSSITGTCLQPAGSVVYGTPTVALSYATAPAAGGTLHPVFSVTQPWGWNNDTDAGVLSYDLESLPDGSSVRFITTAGTVGSEDGSITVPTKGTTESGVTTYSTITCNVTVNGKSASTNANISQAANTKTLNSIRIKKRQPDDSWVSVDSWDNVAANGGMLGILGYNVYKYSSGSSSESKLDPTSVSPTVNIDVGWAKEYNAGFINGCVNIPTRATTIGNKRDGHVSWTINKLTSNSLSFSQAGNYIEAINLSGGSMSYPIIAAGATSATPLVVPVSVSYTYTSGGTATSSPGAEFGVYSASVSFSLGSVKNGFTSVNSSNGVLTATNRGTTVGAARTSGTVTRTLIATWTPTSSYNAAGTKTNTWSTTATCTQEANTLTWNTPTISRTTPVSIDAGGGSNNVATGLTYSQTGKYSSGSPASASSGGSLSYSVVTAKTGFSLSGSTVTVTNNTSTSARNGFVVRITLTLNGKTATKDITYNQAAGYYTYATPVVSASYSTIPASGGTVTPTVSYSQTYGWNGATSGVGTITSGGKVSYSGTSVNTSNGSVTAGSKGTTASGVTKVTTATISVASHGLTGKKSVSVNQAANSIVKYNYGNYTASLSSNSTAALAAGADKRTITWGYIRRSRTPVYTSGDSGSASTETWSGTAYLTISVNSGTSYCSVSPSSYTNSSSTTSSTLTKTTYGTTIISAQTYTLQVRQGSASGTVVASILVTSKANAVTNSNYNPRITTYGTPTVSIGPGMTAAGGSATVSHSVTNTQTYNALYTSGDTGPNQTRSVAGTSTISITSNGNNAFSLSGNTLSHRDMATTLTTDSVTITAKNSGDTSKTKTASKSITNSREATGRSGGVTTYGNVVAGTITNKTIPASGGSATATAGNGSQSWSKTAVVTTYTYTSGDTKQETTTAASSGNNTIAPSVSSITANASSKGQTVSGQTTVKSQAVTWSGSASKSASGTMYIYQAANSLKSYSNVLINQFGYNIIQYSGGTSSPAMDITYDVTYDSGTYRDEHGLPSGYSISFSISGSGFSINASTGVVTAQANTNTSTRSATVIATIRNSSGAGVTSATAKVTQAAKPEPVDIYITTSFNYGNSTIQLNFSIAPKDTFFIKFMGYDQFGSIWEYTTGITPSIDTSFQISPLGYNITDQFSIEGVGPNEFTISPTSPYETSNALYYW